MNYYVNFLGGIYGTHCSRINRNSSFISQNLFHFPMLKHNGDILNLYRILKYHVQYCDKFKNKRIKSIWILKDLRKLVHGFPNRAILNFGDPIWPLRAFREKVAFLQKNQFSIGQSWRKLVKKGILELYLVKFTWKLKFFQVWSKILQVHR